MLTQAIEDSAYEEVKKAIKQAESDPEVSMHDLTKFIYVDNNQRKHYIYVDFIRGKLYEESIKGAGQKY